MSPAGWGSALIVYDDIVRWANDHALEPLVCLHVEAQVDERRQAVVNDGDGSGRRGERGVS